jgi:glycosyltransferase involved in cell wall biosynthesis
MERVIDFRRKTDRPLRIALLAPPMVPVPPKEYGGTERVVAALERELVRRGHEVTTYAAGDSEVAGELRSTLDRSLWASGYRGDVTNFVNRGIAVCWAEHERFDVIHSHVETMGFLFARHCPTPVVSTLHGRLDNAGIPLLLDEFQDIPLVAISRNQRRWWPDNNWVATIHHGLPLDQMPFGERPGEYLVLVGRMSPEKGIAEAIEVARRGTMPLRIAAKVHDADEEAYFREVLEPALGEEDGIEFLGPLDPLQRDPLFAGAFATLMLGSWPEPFGLTAIESLATGTPVISRKSGALPEIIEHGVDGFLVDDIDEAALAVSLVPTLSRERIRERALSRFSVERMGDDYEQVYRRLIAERADRGPGRSVTVPVGGASVAASESSAEKSETLAAPSVSASAAAVPVTSRA